MPIGGFVINFKPRDKEAVLARLAEEKALEVHGVDDDGNIVAVLDTPTSDEMDTVVHALEKDELILNVGLAYLHAEDELEGIRKGDIKPKGFFGGRRAQNSD
ncbi:nitrate reductase formation protein NapD [bacterium DOLJORAL78_65_58]|nr:MAG: nitrate reductase formation protein NapD [bacterium DOLZORAL124_64_63]PIE76054.1 MAG: nitrate reductase formation protein NapD [bacterium DOLJORAL78_65_58]